MKLSKEGFSELAGHEAIVLTRYLDSNKIWTIGIGHTAKAGGIDPATFKGKLTLPEALDLFKHDLVMYEKQVNYAFEGYDLTQEQYDTAVSFHYNTGAISYAGWVKHVRRGDLDLAEHNLQSGIMAWRTPGSLIGRRKKEQKLFFHGKYSNNGKVALYPANADGKILWGSGEIVSLSDYYDTQHGKNNGTDNNKHNSNSGDSVHPSIDINSYSGHRHKTLKQANALMDEIETMLVDLKVLLNRS